MIANDFLIYLQFKSRRSGSTDRCINSNCQRRCTSRKYK